jgi:hypothetical protein
MKGVCIGALFLVVIIPLGSGLASRYGEKRQLHGEVTILNTWLLSTVMSAMACAPLLMDLVLMVRASHEHGYQMAMIGKSLDMLISYVGVWVLPLLCI